MNYHFDKEEYLRLLEKFKSYTETEFGKTEFEKQVGFAWDGPIQIDTWANRTPRIVVLGKETWGYEGCPKCQILDKPERYNYSRFDTAICRLAYGIHHVWDAGSTLARNDLYYPGADVLKEYYSRIAVVEIKKTSTYGHNTHASDKEVFEHSAKNREYLLKQLELLSPHIIFCSGMVTWNSLVTHIGYLGPESSKLAYKQGVFCIDGKLAISSYHPSSRGHFNLINVLNDICKAIPQIKQRVESQSPS
jgi:hypothetical protein